MGSQLQKSSLTGRGRLAEIEILARIIKLMVMHECNYRAGSHSSQLSIIVVLCGSPPSIYTG